MLILCSSRSVNKTDAPKAIKATGFTSKVTLRVRGNAKNPSGNGKQVVKRALKVDHRKQVCYMRFSHCGRL